MKKSQLKNIIKECIEELRESKGISIDDMKVVEDNVEEYLDYAYYQILTGRF